MCFLDPLSLQLIAVDLHCGTTPEETLSHNIGAFIIKGFGCMLYYTYNTELPIVSIGNY